jgi:hypothetical protein
VARVGGRYDQVILIPGGGPAGTGAKEVLDLFSHPEAAGVDPRDRRWRGWTSGELQIAERIGEATTGYAVRPGVADAIATLLEPDAKVTVTRVVTAGQGSPRSGWTRLTTDYRRRLERRGITRAAWESGADLRSARGHAPTAPRGAAGYELTMRYLTGVESRTDDAQRRLRTYNQRGRRPGWIPDGLSDDVVAALSQLRGTPADWSGVQLVPAPNGEPWAMVVSYR